MEHTGPCQEQTEATASAAVTRVPCEAIASAAVIRVPYELSVQRAAVIRVPTEEASPAPVEPQEFLNRLPKEKLLRSPNGPSDSSPPRMREFITHSVDLVSTHGSEIMKGFLLIAWSASLISLAAHMQLGLNANNLTAGCPTWDPGGNVPFHTWLKKFQAWLNLTGARTTPTQQATALQMSIKGDGEILVWNIPQEAICYGAMINLSLIHI